MFLKTAAESATSDFGSWYEDRSERLWGQIRSLVQAKASASVLIFGPPGTGKTSLAVRIAQRAVAELSGLEAFFVDCASLSIVPDVSDSNLLGEKVGDFSEEPKGKFLLVLDEIDALTRDRPLSKLSATIWARLRSMWLMADDSHSRIVLATCRDPSTLDPVLLDRFNLVHYLAPGSPEELGSLVRTVSSRSASMPRARIQKVAGEITKLLAGAQVQRFAQNAFLRAFYEELGQPGAAAMTPATVARHVCAAGSSAFFDGATVSKYEQENQPFIVRSHFLDRVG